MKNLPPRVWQIDFFRGIAICLMVSFHLAFDLNYYWDYPVSYLSGFWYYVGKLSAILFTFIAGISSCLSPRQIYRGLVVFAWGLLISFATYLIDPQTYIRFGILHMQGSCMLLFPLGKTLRPAWLAVAGTVILIAGKWTAQLTGPVLLLPLGVTPASFQSLDYYPLLPWAGIFLYGAALGKIVFSDYEPQSQPVWARHFASAGRHSLKIYLLHQPVLVALLYLAHLF
jgi:uncharacterized membrane protein